MTHSHKRSLEENKTNFLGIICEGFNPFVYQGKHDVGHQQHISAFHIVETAFFQEP